MGAGQPLAHVPDRVRPVHAVIFDMDGTLVQTRNASWEIFREVSRRFSLGVDTPEQYYELFRNNIFTTLEALCRDGEQAREVKDAFLAGLRNGYHPVMIPGMVHVVRRLASVATLALLSSNAMPVVRRILVENDLAFCFAHVFGGDAVADKRTAIEQFLEDAGSGFGRRCSADYDEEMVPLDVAADGTVLVTDTAGDVREARAAGIRAVGVSWGMHPVDQLVEAGAEFVALWPQEVGSYLLQGIDAVPRGACGLPRRDAGRTPGGACCGRCATGTPTVPEADPAQVRRARRVRAVQALLDAPASPPPDARAPAVTTTTTATVRARRSTADLEAAVRRICR